MYVCVQVFNTESMSGGGDRCQLLGSLDTSMEVITNGAVGLTRGAMQGIKGTSDVSVGYIQWNPSNRDTIKQDTFVPLKSGHLTIRTLLFQARLD